MAVGPPPPPQPNFALAFGSVAFLGVAALAMMAGHQPETVILRAVVGGLLAAAVGALAGFVLAGISSVHQKLHKGGEVDAILDDDISLPPPMRPKSQEELSAEVAEAIAANDAAAAASANSEAPAQNFAPIDYKQAAKQIQGMLKEGPGGS